MRQEYSLTRAVSPRQFVVAGATLWCAAILAAPLLGIEAVYVFFSTICHQNPDRTWFIAGEPLGVCVRCASIYMGFFLSLIVRIPASRRLLKIALALTVTEFLLARAGLDFALSRSVTGLLLGLAAAGFVEAGVSELFWNRLHRFQERPSQ